MTAEEGGAGRDTLIGKGGDDLMFGGLGIDDGDGGWGEHHTSCLEGHYVENERSQVIQTAWALTTLLEARDPDWEAIDRAAQFRATAQHEDGTWPIEGPAGVFFHTALLHYTLYRSYFPVWALGLYETRRTARQAITTPHASIEPALG